MSEQQKGRGTEKDLSGIESCLAALKKIDFELAYLALLTREGIKPLSRWEKPLENKEVELLQATGLHKKSILRTVKTGREVNENIFSKSRIYIELYSERFENKPIEKSADTQRYEGFLFGYPPCCIEQYILRPYAANNLDEEDRKIFFHWACSDCKISPFLLHSYRKIFEVLQNL
jgi:hypothetical protein